ncbi:MAG: FtsX-like permease family protein, partial [Gemmatimonadota bacterium]
ASSVHFDTFAAAVVLMAAVVVALVLALLPAGGTSNATSITLQSRRLTSRSRTPWLVTAEAALALVLAVFASLTVRSFNRLSSVDLGFDANGLHAMRVAVSADSSTSPAVTFARLLENLRAIPGVADAVLTSRRPLGDGGVATTIAPQAATESDRSARPAADVRMVDSHYFAALQLHTRSGRLFSGNERQGAPPVAIVNEALVRSLWPDAPNAVGRKFQLALFDDIEPEIVAVVADMRLIAPRQEARPTVYLSAEQYPDNVYDVLLRSDLAWSALMPTVRRVVDRTIPGTPVYSTASVAEMVADAMATERVTALLLGFFAVSALVLVAVGVYGVFAGDVARRRQELGVRMALGEAASRIVRSMLSRTLTLVVIGMVAGVTISVFATRALRTVLYGIPTGDIASHGAAIALVMVTALGATLIPAIAATRIDPVRALRSD